MMRMVRPPNDRASWAEPAVSGSAGDSAVTGDGVVTGNAGDDSENDNAIGRARAGGFAGAALMIASLTVLSRIVGFGRSLILGRVADANISQAYVTANTIPNIIFEIVAGGALASLVVPLVAGAIARADRQQVGRTASALLTWVLSILIPLGVLVAIFARPIVTLAIPSSTVPGTLEAGTQMLRVFAPQIPLYGIAIVLGGLLQAHRRFAWPVLAPLFSSAVVIATYVTYGVTQHQADTVTGRMILAVGTTLGVVVLALCMVPAVTRLRVPWRATYRFGDDARHTVASLAGVAVITVVAQQLSLFVAIRLANGVPSVPSSAFMFTLAQTVYLVPWSVFALPVATSVYPSLAAAAATGDDEDYRRTLATSTRSVLLLSAFGAAALIAAATPLARLFARIASETAPDPHTLSLAFATFAPALLGYGLFALHSRALYARAQNRYAAFATLIGWGVVIAASFVLSALMPAHLRVVALTTANSVGMTVLAFVLGAVLVRRTGRGSLAGLPRATAAALIAGAAAAAAGIAVRVPLTDAPGVVVNIAEGMLSGVVAVVVFATVAAALDRHDVRPLLIRLTRIAGRARRTASTGENGAMEGGGEA
jgi:putative peptidoglycan lipid II flippase